MQQQQSTDVAVFSRFGVCVRETLRSPCTICVSTLVRLDSWWNLLPRHESWDYNTGTTWQTLSQQQGEAVFHYFLWCCSTTQNCSTDGQVPGYVKAGRRQSARFRPSSRLQHPLPVRLEAPSLYQTLSVFQNNLSSSGACNFSLNIIRERSMGAHTSLTLCLFVRRRHSRGWEGIGGTM